jgi:hypothetical protein
VLLNEGSAQRNTARLMFIATMPLNSDHLLLALCLSRH